MTTYVYADARPLAQHDYDTGTAGMYFYLQDRLGSVRMLIDDSGVIENTYTYEPVGEPIEESATQYNPFTFTGQYYDSEIAEYYLRARQYCPQTARFTGRDPVFGEHDEPLTLHKYLYCLNDPINTCDLSGRAPKSKEETAGILGMGASVDAVVIGGAAATIYLGARNLVLLSEQRNAAVATIAAGLSHDVDAVVDFGIGWYTSFTTALAGDESIPYSDDPTVAPGDGFEWRGEGEPGSKDGNYYNPDTGETLPPDLDHGPPIGPHWDYKKRGEKGKGWRIFPDGRMEPK